MNSNTALNHAARAKKDEFYTQLSDIEKDLWKTFRDHRDAGRPYYAMEQGRKDYAG